MTDEPTRVGNYLVPKGVFVHIDFFRMHNDPVLWPHAHKFRPGRWADGEDGSIEAGASLSKEHGMQST